MTINDNEPRQPLGPGAAAVFSHHRPVKHRRLSVVQGFSFYIQQATHFLM
ncbi:hypothetical protein HPTD01_1906 [Halomonas sp. TD01]|nr:hypothetical protein HPTD01_1906 [Halomonas sp. TD01]